MFPDSRFTDRYNKSQSRIKPGILKSQVWILIVSISLPNHSIKHRLDTCTKP